MSQGVQDAWSVTWSRVEDGFYVASRGGDFLGFLDRREGDRFAVFGGRGEPRGEAVGLTAAMDALLAGATVAGAADEEGAGLVSVVYTSFATSRFDDERLADLLVRSRAANGGRDVTGLLLYREGRFLQVLEGPAAVVRDLVDAIQGDRRHHGLRVISEDRIDGRRFADWSMAYRPWTTPSGDLPDGFRDAFDDLDDASDELAALRAVRELSAWFRYRADSARDDGD